MTIKRGLTAVGGCAIGGGAIGGLVGFLIGLFAPGAYRAMFHIRHAAAIDVLHVGVGLGIAQGTILGVVIGILLVAIVTWYEVRVKQADD